MFAEPDQILFQLVFGRCSVLCRAGNHPARPIGLGASFTLTWVSVFKRMLEIKGKYTTNIKRFTFFSVRSPRPMNPVLTETEIARWSRLPLLYWTVWWWGIGRRSYDRQALRDRAQNFQLWSENEEWKEEVEGRCPGDGVEGCG